MSDTSARIPSVRFQSAEAVWLKGRRLVMNDFVGFRAMVRIPDEAQSVLLRLTASTVYRAFVNGVFSPLPTKTRSQIRPATVKVTSAS
jgi:hypothetical protein